MGMHVLRWLNLGLAVVCLVGPMNSTFWIYRHYTGEVLTRADILESRLIQAGTRGMGAKYDLYVRYRVGGRQVSHNVSVTASIFDTPRTGGNIGLFVDPKTFEVVDDIRLSSWIMVLLGGVAAAVLVGGSIGIGRMLRRT
jgi:hypothetical protein